MPDTDGRYFWLDPKVTKKSRLNQPHYFVPVLDAGTGLPCTCSRATEELRGKPRAAGSLLGGEQKAPSHIFPSFIVQR